MNDLHTPVSPHAKIHPSILDGKQPSSKYFSEFLRLRNFFEFQDQLENQRLSERILVLFIKICRKLVSYSCVTFGKIESFFFHVTARLLWY